MINLICLEGIVAFPTAMVNKDENTLKCTPCGSTKVCPSDTDARNKGAWDILWSRDETAEVNVNDSQRLIDTLKMSTSVQEVINTEWVDAYCVVDVLGIQIQYFPYYVLLMAICLCLVQKVSNL